MADRLAVSKAAQKVIPMVDQMVGKLVVRKAALLGSQKAGKLVAPMVEKTAVQWEFRLVGLLAGH